MQDRAPSEEVMVYRRIFGHPQISIPRLSEALPKIHRPLSARPTGPPPKPFGDEDANNNNGNNTQSNNGNANMSGKDEVEAKMDRPINS